MPKDMLARRKSGRKPKRTLPAASRRLHIEAIDVRVHGPDIHSLGQPAFSGLHTARRMAWRRRRQQAAPRRLRMRPLSRTCASRTRPGQTPCRRGRKRNSAATPSAPQPRLAHSGCTPPHSAYAVRRLTNSALLELSRLSPHNTWEGKLQLVKKEKAKNFSRARSLES